MQWLNLSPRERANIVRQHAAPRIRVEPGMKVQDLATLFQISKKEIEAILDGADFPDT